jgi:site-specific DNA-adenine methylase
MAAGLIFMQWDSCAGSPDGPDFNRYTPGQFRESDHIRLAACCRELDLRGIRWAVSNSDTDFIADLFQGYRIERLENRREINLNSGDRDVTELLIMNFADPYQCLTFGSPQGNRP